MKATLSFNLPDEEYAYRLAINGARYQAALYDLRMAIRDKVKYAVEATTTWDDVSDMFWQIIREADVELD